MTVWIRSRLKLTRNQRQTLTNERRGCSHLARRLCGLVETKEIRLQLRGLWGQPALLFQVQVVEALAVGLISPAFGNYRLVRWYQCLRFGLSFVFILLSITFGFFIISVIISWPEKNGGSLAVEWEAAQQICFILVVRPLVFFLATLLEMESLVRRWVSGTRFILIWRTLCVAQVAPFIVLLHLTSHGYTDDLFKRFFNI